MKTETFFGLLAVFGVIMFCVSIGIIINSYSCRNYRSRIFVFALGVFLALISILMVFFGSENLEKNRKVEPRSDSGIPSPL